VLATFCRVPDHGLTQLDIRAPRSIETLLARVRPSVIYLASAAADVDACETQPRTTSAVNVEGVANVLAAARQHEAHVILFSTDYVFDGRAGPYNEQDEPRPVCEYGRQKLEAERMVLRDGGLVLRTAVVYGFKPGGRSFLPGLLQRLREGRQIELAADLFGSPTDARDLARAAIELARARSTELLHVSGPSTVDRAAFGREAAAAFGFDPELVKGVSSSALARSAPRPLRAGLCSRRAQERLPFALRDHRVGLWSLAASVRREAAQ
jgi:dTDP-4-dehydrorhamnose reductase